MVSFLDSRESLSFVQRHPPGSLYQAQAGTEHWAVPVASAHPSTLETPEEEKDTPQL